MIIGKCDIGLMWAKAMAVVGQVGTVQGIVNTFMIIGVFYTTTVKPFIGIPLWVYLSIIILGGSVLVLFILTIGISGYYRFLNQQSALSEINKKLDILLKEKHDSVDHGQRATP